MLICDLPAKLVPGTNPQRKWEKVFFGKYLLHHSRVFVANIANAVFGRKKKHCNMTIFMFFRFSSQVNVS